MFYEYKNEVYLLNLIDTPGHVDFNYEVSRSLAACDGVILLIDANQGIQAQTVANFYLAFESELSIIPAMNKVDLKVAKPDIVQRDIVKQFDFEPRDILRISAKTGLNVDKVLPAVIDRIPPPRGNRKDKFKGLVFDSSYDKFKGAVCNVAIKEGSVSVGDKITLAHTGNSVDVSEIGIMYPDEVCVDTLYAGQVGYMYANLKNCTEAQIGDTLHHHGVPVEKLPGFKPANPMVFAGIFPMDQGEYTSLKSAIERLLLNDSSVEVNIDSSAALGQGWRLGFLGLLHLDVFSQRLEHEYDSNVIITTPNVPYKVKIFGEKHIKKYKTDTLTILNPCLLPESTIVESFQEPMVLSTIISPDAYVGAIISLIQERRGEQLDQSYIDEGRIQFKVVFPLNEVIVDFFDRLKSITSGYASFDYEDHGYRESSLVKVEILLNGTAVEELTQICHSQRARELSKRLVAKLKSAIPAQLYDIMLQACVGKKIIARENIKANRKDVLAKCYGGDITRKMKLLRRQAEGKKRMRTIGNIHVPKDAFISVLKR